MNGVNFGLFILVCFALVLYFVVNRAIKDTSKKQMTKGN